MKPLKKRIITVDVREEQREQCLSDLEAFISFVQPRRLIGNIHRRLIRWLTRQDARSHQIVLLPRDHGKSAYAAFWSVWMLTKDPTLRILYISSSANLATKQLKFMKDILLSDNYRLLWPEMVSKEEAKREKWTEREISVDHPRRKEESIRDPSIFTAGLTTNTVGMHCDITVMDDIVVSNNVYTESAREKVKQQYGFLSSVAGTSSKLLIVGTRYDPNDLYNDLINKKLQNFNELGELQGEEPLFEKFEEQVESVGDGTGEFLWPRQQSSYGAWYGFDVQILAKKRADYDNQNHFRAQYYNDPHDTDSAPIKRDQFQYFDHLHVYRRDNNWYFKQNKLNVTAAIDFAYTTGKKSDFTSIVVVGLDGGNNYYVLDIDRFKTDKISEYFNRILKMHEKWGFRKIRAEITAAQSVIVKDLQENYIRPHGLALAVDEFRPSRWEGSKEERILATLEPKYANRQIWHYTGGHCQLLEEELIFSRPPHDDIKDALASAVDFVFKPTASWNQSKRQHAFSFHSRWGGVT